MPPPRLPTLLAFRRSDSAPRLALGALLAFFIAPCLHTLSHRNDHRHVGPDGGGIVWTAETHSHPHADDRDHPTLEGPSPAPHGRGAFAHFGAAVTAPEVSSLPRVVRPIIALDPAAPASGQPRPALLLSARPRGPPLTPSARS